jgi:hypothetical protein
MRCKTPVAGGRRAVEGTEWLAWLVLLGFLTLLAPKLFGPIEEQEVSRLGNEYRPSKPTEYLPSYDWQPH